MLLDEVCARIRRLNKASAPKTPASIGCRVCLVHVWHHPRDMGATEIKAFLAHLAIADKVSASIQNHAKSARDFLSAGAED